MVDANARCDSSVTTWHWREERDAGSWLPARLDELLTRATADKLVFQSTSYDGHAEAYTRKGQPVLHFYYDLTLKDCSWLEEKFGPQDVTFDIIIRDISKDTTNICLRFVEYDHDVDSAVRASLLSGIRDAVKTVVDEFHASYAKDIEEKIRIKNAGGAAQSVSEVAKADTANRLAQTEIAKAKGNNRYAFCEEFIAGLDIIFSCFTDQNMMQNLTQCEARVKLERGTEIAWLNGAVTGRLADFSRSADHAIVDFDLRLTSWPEEAQLSRLHVEITRLDSSTCRLAIEHSNLPNAASHVAESERLWRGAFIDKIKAMFGPAI